MTHTSPSFSLTSPPADLSNSRGGNDNESWFISYTDILLLLLTFFVLLFAFSKVEGVASSPSDTAESVAAVAATLPSAAASMVEVSEPLETKAGETEVALQTAAQSVQPSLAETAIADGRESETSEQTTAGVSPPATQTNGHEPLAVAAVYHQAEQGVAVLTPAPSELGDEAGKPVEAAAESIPIVATTAPHIAIDAQLARLTQGLTEDEVEVAIDQQTVTIELNNAILFLPGEANLLSEGQEFLSEIAHIMAASDYSASIEGHTDNVPINTARFPSNWELSSARATTVARFLIDQAISPNRLRAIGYADTRPKTGNDTPEQRSRNRRVSVLFHLDPLGNKNS